MDLKGIRTEDLERELERRQQEARQKEQSLPEPLGEPDFSNLQKIVIGGFRDAVEDQFLPSDFKQRVFETAVEAVFGSGFWVWRRKQVW